MTDPRLLLTDYRLDEIERDAAHSRRLGLTVTFAVVNEQLAFVHELRRLRQELSDARADADRLRATAPSREPVRQAPPVREPSRAAPPARDARQAPIREPERTTTGRTPPPLEIEVVIVQRDSHGRELSRIRQRMPTTDDRATLRDD